MVMSINTNGAAFIALQGLNKTSRDLNITQNRVNTGYKVASAKDDSAAFAIAQNLRANVSGLASVTSSLNRAQSTIDVGLNAAEQISDVLIQMKAKAAAGSAEADATARGAYLNDFNALSNQLASLLNSASFNGINLLRDAGGGGNLTAILSADGKEVMTVNGQAMDKAGTGALKDFIDPASTTAGAKGKTAVWATTAAATASHDLVVTAIGAVNTVMSTLGAASRRAEGQIEFTQKLTDSLEVGIGNVVDADMAKESAKLQALQIKQQLGLQALGIANQAPQSILSLFR